LTEGFDGARILAVPPTGWTILNLDASSTTWKSSNAKYRSPDSSALMAYNYSVNQDDWLVLPPLDLTGAVAPKWSFYEDQNYWTDADHHRLYAVVGSSFNLADTVLLADYTPANHTIGGFAGAPVEVSLTPYANQPVVWLAFRYTGLNADNWYIDDVKIAEPPAVNVAMEFITIPGQIVRTGSTLTPAVRLTSLNAAIADSMIMTIEDATPAIVYADTVLNVALAAGTADYAFTRTWASVPAGEYTVNARVVVAGDSPTDNSATDEIKTTSTTLTLPVAEGFDATGLVVPPAGWTILDYGNAVGDGWFASTTKARSVPNSAAVLDTPQTSVKDEWLVMAPMDFASAVGPTLKFFEE